MSRRWKGELAQPIKLSPPPNPPTLLTRNPESEAKYKQEYAKWLNDQKYKFMGEHAIKLAKLCEHYGLDIKEKEKDVWFELALALAKDHVPGFRVEQAKQSGRPKERDESFLARLYFDFEQAREERKSKGLPAKITDICSALARDANYQDISKKTIGNLYQQAKASPLVKLYCLVAPRIPKEISEQLREIFTPPR